MRCSSWTQVAEAVRKLNYAACMPSLAQQFLFSEDVAMKPISFSKSVSRPLMLAWHPRQAAMRPRLQQAIRELRSILDLSATDP